MAVLVGAASVSAQDSQPNGTASPPPMTVEEAMHQPTVVEATGRSARRIELETAALAVRERRLSGAPSGAYDLQNSAVFRGRFNLEPNARLTLHAGVATGRGFNGGWNSPGFGAIARSESITAKQLFVSAAPWSGIEIQSGGLYLQRGESTEATSYDNDGYVVGHRLILGRSLNAAPARIIVTTGRLGEFDDANVFRRLRQYGRLNYYQLLATKRLARLDMSADYTVHSGIPVVRAAVNWDVTRTRMIDRLRIEQYWRHRAPAGYGLAVAMQRGVGERVMFGGGFSMIDPAYGPLNSDAYRTGRRLQAAASWRVGAFWMASIQIVQALNSDARGPRSRVDLALGLDLRRAIAATR